VTDLLVTGCLLLFVDQLSKRMVEARVGDRRIAFGSVVQIRFVAGRNAFFSSAAAPLLLVAIWLAALASAFALAQSGTWFQSRLSMFALGLAFGGAASNVLDLARRRHIVDFIDLGWWPVFNLADVGIVAGLAMALWGGAT
jgi:signal peptidase II